jgi:Ca2+:H+ antiporter
VTQTSALARARAEAPLLFILTTLAAFLLLGTDWLADLSNPLWLTLVFGWLFATIFWAALKVVHHADCLAVKLGEPYGTPILTLSVISIEVLMISALMLSAQRTYLLLGVVHLILFLTYLMLIFEG